MSDERKWTADLEAADMVAGLRYWASAKHVSDATAHDLKKAADLLLSQSAELKAKDERIAELENLTRSTTNIVDAYEASMRAIREALGLSEFDDHELVIDEIKVKQLLLLEQASRLGTCREAFQAISEEGWMFCGPEGPTEAQQKIIAAWELLRDVEEQEPEIIGIARSVGLLCPHSKDPDDCMHCADLPERDVEGLGPHPLDSNDDTLVKALFVEKPFPVESFGALAKILTDSDSEGL